MAHLLSADVVAAAAAVVETIQRLHAHRPAVCCGGGAGAREACDLRLGACRGHGPSPSQRTRLAPQFNRRPLEWRLAEAAGTRVGVPGAGWEPGPCCPGGFEPSNPCTAPLGTAGGAARPRGGCHRPGQPPLRLRHCKGCAMSTTHLPWFQGCMMLACAIALAAAAVAPAAEAARWAYLAHNLPIAATYFVRTPLSVSCHALHHPPVRARRAAARGQSRPGLLHPPPRGCSRSCACGSSPGAIGLGLWHLQASSCPAGTGRAGAREDRFMPSSSPLPWRPPLPVAVVDCCKPVQASGVRYGPAWWLARCATVQFSCPRPVHAVHTIPSPCSSATCAVQGGHRERRPP